MGGEKRTQWFWGRVLLTLRWIGIIPTGIILYIRVLVIVGSKPKGFPTPESNFWSSIFSILFYFVLYVSVVFHPSYTTSIVTRVGLNHFEHYFLNHIKSCSDRKKWMYVGPSYLRSLDRIVHNVVINSSWIVIIGILEKTGLGKIFKKNRIGKT